MEVYSWSQHSPHDVYSRRLFAGPGARWIFALAITTNMPPTLIFIFGKSKPLRGSSMLARATTTSCRQGSQLCFDAESRHL